MNPVTPIPTVQMQVASPQLPRRSRYTCSVKSLGILQIVLAGVSAALGVAAAVVSGYYTLAFIAPGAWGGLAFYLPAGILGILSITVGVTSRRCLAIATMVMSILAAVMAGTNIILYGICISESAYYRYSYYFDVSAELGLSSVLVVASLTELVVSIVASAYCCYVMKEYQPATTTIQYGHPAMYNMYNQQPAAYPGPTAAQAPAMFVTNQAAAAAPPPSYGNAAEAGIDDPRKGNINLA
ncbi:uncharacterized protein LOC110980877 [Acanthaster planci]|uniref:Uncharacterized protein LOC110980877 n=1 Tax=Acanthaster planci TaxID=133434 RepID=A0A8B7YMD5_ACAPL|nr:uncharacterized protein LOC110980877 [Acanthaster planci]